MYDVVSKMKVLYIKEEGIILAWNWTKNSIKKLFTNDLEDTVILKDNKY